LVIGGSAWNDAELPDAVRSVAASTSVGGVAFAVAAGVVYKTIDGGLTWFSTSAPVDGNDRVFAGPATPHTFYVASSSGLFRSTDEGASWTQTPLSFWTTGLAIAPGNPNRLFAATHDNGVQMSADGGVTWIALNTGLGTMSVNDVATDVTGTKVWASTPQSVWAYEVQTNQPPVANAGVSQTVECSGPNGTLVTLDGSASSDPDNDTLTYTWTTYTFAGPLGNASGVSPIVTLPLGAIAITLSVSDGHGHTASATTNVTVVDTTPPSIDAHGDVTVQATSAAGAIVNYTSPASHDLVDGAGVASCGPASGAQFALGDTTVHCSATDAHGNSANSQFVVHVVNQPPVADAGPDKTVIVGEAVTFDGSASHDADGTIASYAWNFGDNTTGSGAVVTKTYAAAGVRSVVLTVTDNAGASATDSATATVLTPGQAIQSMTTIVASFNLQQGITNSLDSKIQNAVDAMSAANAGSRSDAANKLLAFINSVEAQRGKQLTNAQADTLEALARRILAVI